ncbi:MAG: DUF4957 domain-containing protein, partial [Candidatus Marinimicrobia bacterium]|nr:DUF4957 domain-containing protein [Candidatus Neomarinimicrobiota bacterium]
THLGGSYGTAENMINADPMLADAANRDLTLLEGSPAIDAGTVGQSIGDPRWWPATVFEVAAGTDAISTALAAAGAGDVLELITDGGSYLETSTLIIDREITIRAAAGLTDKPVLISDSDSSMIQLYNHLNLAGVMLDGAQGAAASDMAFDPYDASARMGYELVVENCDFTNFTTGILASRTGTQAELVSFNNCLITNIGDKAIAFNTDDISPAGVKNLSVTNSTFINIGDDVIAVYPFESDVSEVNLVVDQVTFYDIDDKGIYPSHILGAMVTNVIAANPADVGNTFFYFYNGSTILNSLYWNFPGTHIGGSYGIAENMINADPLFTDPANGDLTLQAGSPALGVGTTGLPIGDPRWWPAGSVDLVVVAGTDGIAAALAEAVAGQTIYLVTDGGVYQESATLIIDKNIRLAARVGLDEKPMIISGSTDAMIEFSADFVLDGVILDGAQGGAATAVGLTNTPGTSGYNLTVLNSDFVNMVDAAETQGFGIFGDPTSVVDSVFVQNSYFAHIWEMGISFNDPITATGSVNHFEVDNCTFWDMHDEAIYVDGSDSDLSTPDPEFLVNQVTVYNCSDYSIIPHYIDYAVITNSMVVLPVLETAYAPAKIYGINSRIENFLYFNTRDIDLSGGATDFQLINVVVQEDPLLTDPENGDFSYPMSSPAVIATEDGPALLGDSRWWPVVWGATLDLAAGTDVLSAALAEASPGLTIVLTTDGGTYDESATLVVDKAVRIIAAEGLTDKPMITSGATGAMIEFSADFLLDGVLLDGALGAAMSNTGIKNAANTSGYNLTVLNCDFLNMEDVNASRGFGIYGDVSSVVDSVFVQNSYFAHILDMGISFNDPLTATGSVNYFEVDNCTFWDMNSEAIYVDGFDSDVATPDPKFLVNKVTVYDCGSYNIIPHYIDYAVITNSMVVYPVLETAFAPAKIYGAHSVIENFLYFNTRDIDLSSGATDFQLINVVVQEDPLLTDPENGDFSYPENSPAYLTVAGERVAIGDDRWWFLLPVGVDNAKEQIPTTYLLAENYPNPFNPTTLIDFQLPEAGNVSLVVHDVLGREVNRLVNGEMQPGYYQTSWNGLTSSGTSVSGGVYFYTIRSGSFVQTKKMLYLK